MKHFHRIEFAPGRTLKEDIAAMLRRLKLDQYRWSDDRLLDLVEIWVPYASEEGPIEIMEALERKGSELRGEGYQLSFYLDREYEQEDFDQALVFEFDVTRALTFTPFAPRNADWDLSRMCSVCGAGAHPRGGMRLNKSQIAKGANIIETARNEFHARADLKDLIVSELGCSEDFRQDSEVRHPDRLLPWWYLHPVNVLQPQSLREETNLEKYCSNCPDGYFGSKENGRPVVKMYELTTEQAERIPPFSRSFEFWGESSLVEDEIRRIIYSRQSILVNRACREFFLRHKIRHLEFRPIVSRVID